MSDIDTGGQAFPCDAEWKDGKEVWPAQSGMTLRDWFAGQAMSGIASGHDSTGLWMWTAKDAASTAYTIADAMIKARG